ncbi:MAG: hypothetical protein HQ559_12820 [Lentisphaerae bacterium]|nr:hypothetical protein [Lentisphaerota bacterium]
MNKAKHNSKRWPGRLLPVLVAVFVAASGSVGAFALDAPDWQAGLTWKVASTHRQIANPVTRTDLPEIVWTFVVEQECVVDGVAAYSLRISPAGDESYPELRLFCAKDSLVVLRFELLGQIGNEPLKTVHLFLRDTDGPTVVPSSLVPLSLPLFSLPGTGVFTYDHAVNGLDGFSRTVTQATAEDGGLLQVSLVSGSTRIVQRWRAGLPWPAETDVNEGTARSRLVEGSVIVQEEDAGDTGPALELDRSAEFGPRHGGRWWPTENFSERLPWSAEPEQVEEPATRSDFSLFAAPPAEDVTTSLPWSGYWWPMLQGFGHNLYAEGGPLDKYDQYVFNLTGSNPSPTAVEWEYDHNRTTNPDNTWWGHCDGWAAASILDPEPIVPVDLLGVHFTVGDRKGILTTWRTEGRYATVWGDIYTGAPDDRDDIYPYEFITVLIQHIVNQDVPLLVDMYTDDQIWNHPVYGYELTELAQNGDGTADFRCRLYYASDGVDRDYVGIERLRRTLEFRCQVDTEGNFTDGPSEWLGTSVDKHPDFVWFPAPTPAENPNRNTGLEKEHVYAIAGPVDLQSSYAYINIRHLYVSDLVVKIGVGDPSQPAWIQTVSDREGGSGDNVVVNVDLAGAAAYLPPSSANPWFLQVADRHRDYTGDILRFFIRHGSRTYSSPDTPVYIDDDTTSYAHIAPPTGAATASAHVDIAHDFIGDLLVRVGVGDPASPQWIETVSDRTGSGSNELVVDIDLGDAGQWLPPGNGNTWFLAVTDFTLQDEGSIRGFSITHDGTPFPTLSTLPVAVQDERTSYVYIGPSYVAHVDLTHTYISDLLIEIGAGDPASPIWVDTIWNHEVGSADDISLDVDISEAAALLPPSQSTPWFLRVTDMENGDEGNVTMFCIRNTDMEYVSLSTPLPIVDRQESVALISGPPPSSLAQIDIGHTWRGDMVVRVGAGDPANPDWVQTVSDRQGGGDDDLVVSVGLDDAVAWLPPSATNPWFLEVTDTANGDEGEIRGFIVVHDGTNFVSDSPPVPVLDNSTSYAHVGRPEPTAVAHVDIAHTWRGDLTVKIGVGNPLAPDWVTTVSAREGGGANDLVRDVDVSDALAFLPPSESAPWFLEVNDAATDDQGTILAFVVSYGGSEYVSDSTPVPVEDNQTVYAHIGRATPSAVAHIDIAHTWIGDLVVDLGVGNPAAPDWIQAVSDRQGGGADFLVVDVDISSAEPFLPPSDTAQWFLRVGDEANGDQGTIREFVIKHEDTDYASFSTPTPIMDKQTSFAYIGKPEPTALAHVEITHTWIGDLEVKVGVGDPASPGWVKTVWDRQGGSGDQVMLDVDVSAADTYLPPGPAQKWFLEVTDHAKRDEGTVQTFSVTHSDTNYTSSSTPVAILDEQTSYAYVE